MDLTKLGRTERVLAIVGLVLFIDSFLSAWYSVSAPSTSVLGVTYGGGSAGFNAWQYPSGFLTWFPTLLFLAVGVLAVLPAFGVVVRLRVSVALLGLGVSALAVLLFLIQWLTYPSVPGDFAGSGISAGPDWAFFIGLVLAVVAGVFSYLGFTAEGGSLAELGQSIKARVNQPQQSAAQPGGYVPPAPGYPPAQEPPAPGSWQQQPPQQ